jgi:hypothetical protein
MTQHVRTSYRRHRKATWALVLGLALLVAAIAIPLATGAPDKTYTMLYPSSGAVTPAAPVAGSTSAQTLCAAATYSSVKIVIANTARAAQLGSANVTFPTTRVTLSGTPTATFSSGTTPSGFSITRSGNVVSLRNLSLPPKSGNTTSSVTFSVALATLSAAGGGEAITAQVKQSNDFSDAGQNPDANAFDNPAFPTIALQACTTTISGRVFLDNDGDGEYDATGTPADAGQGQWSLSLFRTSSPAGQVGSSISSASTGDVGTYTFTDVPASAEYKVCVTPPSGSGSWSQTVPTGSTACDSAALPKGQPVTGLVAGTPKTGVDFGNELTVVPSCSTTFTAPTIGSGSGIVEYRAQLTDPTPETPGCKGAIVMYSYLENGSPFATIHPPASSTDDTEYWVVERLRWKVDEGGSQNPVTLRYDDFKPYDDLKAMKMCDSDPRVGDSGFVLDENPASVMPGAPGEHTTCMIVSTDFPSGNPYNYEAYTVTIVDGLKGR